MLTYRQLLEKLLTLSDSELNQTATVSLDIAEESVSINYVAEIQKGDFLEGVLDDGHIVLGVNF
jgi:hypothetical protein